MAGARHGGAEAFFERLAAALARAGQEQRLVIRRDPERAARLRRDGLDPLELPFGTVLDFTTKPKLGFAIAEFRPRAVLTWMSRATDACPRGDFVHLARLGGYYDLRHYRACDHLIANTRALASWLIENGFAKERVHYLPNFAALEPAMPQPRADLATPDGAPLALALGRLHPNKAFDVLLEAVARTQGLYLWLAGEGPRAGALRRQAVALGISERVRFLGWRTDVGALLGACDMLVCPSRIEPLGNTIIEAWAAKRPVIAARASGPMELIDDGRTGLLVPTDDADALAAAMTRLAHEKSLSADLAAAGHAEFEAHFGVAPVVASYRALFAEVVR